MAARNWWPEEDDKRAELERLLGSSDAPRAGARLTRLPSRDDEAFRGEEEPQDEGS